MRHEIGIVTVEYDQQGSVKRANFKPTIEVLPSSVLIRQLLALPSGEERDTVKANADLVFAGWFSQINEIELSDRNENPISSEVITCEKWPLGKVKTCVLRYLWDRKD